MEFDWKFASAMQLTQHSHPAPPSDQNHREITKIEFTIESNWIKDTNWNWYLNRLLNAVAYVCSKCDVPAGSVLWHASDGWLECSQYLRLCNRTDFEQMLQSIFQ